MPLRSDIFRERVALVTGGGSGLGRALCLDLATQRGATAIVTDIDIRRAEEVSADIRARGGRSLALGLDVSNREDVFHVVGEVVGRFGRIDYMFNNAGIITLGEVRDMSSEHWRELIDVNFLGVLYGTLAAYERMVKQRDGHIVNVASIGGLITLPTYTAYATTKHAVVALSNSLRAEGAGLGVKVSVACPGMMETGLGAAAKILNARRTDLEGQGYKRRGMDPAVAAARILAGVERNKAMIVFPFSSRLLWWMYRLHPTLLRALETRMLATFRAVRTDS